jgi:hypothetical protein
MQITPSPIGNILINDSAFPFHLMPNNIALLTQSHKAIAAKKKARREQIKEITFDDEARRYVFHLILFLSSFFFYSQGIFDWLSQAKTRQKGGRS